MADGRAVQPRRCIPSTMAPDDTSTICRPALVSTAICSAQCATAAWSIPRPSLVTRLEPSLITSRRAPATTELADGELIFSLGRRGHELGRMFLQPVLDRVNELAATLAVDRRDGEHRAGRAISVDERSNALRALFGIDQIQLVQHQPPRLVVQRLVIALELLDDGARIRDRIAGAVERGDIDDMQQHARSLQMAEKLMTEPGAVGGAVDQTGDVGNDEAPVFVDANHAEIRRQGGERIVGDLGPGGGDRTYQRRFARVRHSQQADIGEHLELEVQHALHAFFARCRLPRRAIGARLEMQIAQAALAALRQERFLIVRREVGNELAALGHGDDGPDRHAQHDVLGAASVLIGAAASFAGLGAMNAGKAIIDQRIDVAVGNRPDAAAASPVAAVRAAARNVFLAAKRNRAVAAVARDHFDVRFVDELHRAGTAVGRRNRRKRSLSSPWRRPSQTFSHAESGGVSDSSREVCTRSALQRFDATESSRTVTTLRKYSNSARCGSPRLRPARQSYGDKWLASDSATER